MYSMAQGCIDGPMKLRMSDCTWFLDTHGGGAKTVVSVPEKCATTPVGLSHCPTTRTWVFVERMCQEEVLRTPSYRVNRGGDGCCGPVSIQAFIVA
jgi:hypothetical protein